MATQLWSHSVRSESMGWLALRIEGWLSGLRCTQGVWLELCDTKTAPRRGSFDDMDVANATYDPPERRLEFLDLWGC